MPIFPRIDPEGGIVIVTIGNFTTNLVNYNLASDYSQITFSPTSFTEVGIHSLPIILEDA